MADSKVFAVKILLSDNISPVTADATIGLYNVTSAMGANANAAQADVTVADASDFTAGELVNITDDNDSEQNTIDSIAGNVITMKQVLVNSYTTAANGKVDGNSEFRWLQNSITGVTGWLSGMITKNGLLKWTRQIDLRRGGNISQPGNGGVKVRNTSQFWNALSTLEIYMNGFRAEVWLFTNTVKERRYTGVCEQPKWDARIYTIPFRGDRNKRVSNLTKQVNTTDYPNATGDILNTSIPFTIGKVYPKFDDFDNVEYNGYAKFVRVANKTETFNTDNEVALNDGIILDASPQDLKAFPCVGNDGTVPPLQYKFKVGTTGLMWWNPSVGTTQLTGGTYDLSYFEDYYIHVSEGTEEDSFRRIENAFVDIDTDQTLVIATISDYFEETLDGNATATADDNSWVQLDKVNSDYEIDTWPCKNYLNTSGAAVTQAFNLFAYDNDKKIKTVVTGDEETIKTGVRDAPLEFLRLPDYGYEDSGNDERNKLNIDLKFFDESPDQMDSFLICPVKDVSLISGDSRIIGSNWSIPGDELGISARLEIQPGFYSTHPSTATVTINDNNISNITDKNSTSAYDAHVLVNSPIVEETYFGLEFKPPEIPNKASFDSVYLGIKFNWDWPNMPPFLTQTATLFMRWRRFFGTAKSILQIERNAFTNSTATMDLSNLSDFYYLDNVNTNNQDFYYINTGELVGDTRDYTGYSLYSLPDVSTKEQYNTIYELLFMAKNEGFGNLLPEFDIKMYELAIIFKKSISIKDAIYSPFMGRVYNDTWSGRKTAADAIESPIDTLEHISRLQSYPDTSPIPTNGWGYGYSLGAKIKTGTTTDGSFDNTADLTGLLGNQIMGQPQKYELCYSDKLKTSICRDFFLGSWVDKNGFECVRNLMSTATPSDTITLSDITDRKKIRFVERSPAEIYPEPIVRYKKNFASGEYEDIIRVTNTSAPAYVSGYVEGISSEDEAEAIWDDCNDMWQRTKNINKPPEDLSDKIWFNNPDTSDQMAKEYLLNWITWMSRNTVTFRAHFNTVGDWEETHPFYLQLPHQTNNVTVKCNLTKIVIDPNTPYTCVVTALIEGDIPEEFYIKDTWVNFGDDNDWKNTYTLQGDPDDIKDVM